MFVFCIFPQYWVGTGRLNLSWWRKKPVYDNTKIIPGIGVVCMAFTLAARGCGVSQPGEDGKWHSLEVQIASHGQFWSQRKGIYAIYEILQSIGICSLVFKPMSF